MSKNIVIFSDGTGQEGGVRAEQHLSNVYKLYRVSRVGPDNAIDPSKQVAFYDPGLGTETSATGWTAIVRWAQKLLASVSGRGIAINIADCYEFILNHYVSGDRIYLFGFSRGAYTVRSLANLLMLCGVPTANENEPLPLFRSANRKIAQEAVFTVLEHGGGHPREKYEAERQELARRFREKYGSQHPTGQRDRSNAAPYFVGVFDTVAALGRKGISSLLIQTGLILGAAFLAGVAGLVATGLIATLMLVLGATWNWLLVFSPALVGMALGAGVVFVTRRRRFRKSIRDFPNMGDFSAHYAEWKGENFDRLLSRFVTFARAANSIDETRADFDRVGWGPTRDMPKTFKGHERLRQIWFAGNHSDIGGSYPEAESRLSDIALEWMIREATAVPNGLKTGPIYSNGKKIPNTGRQGQALFLFPDAKGVEHNEVAATADRIESYAPGWLRYFVKGFGWKEKIREVPSDAPLHSTVQDRFRATEVPKYGGSGEYRPRALSDHQKCRAFYSEKDEDYSSGAPTGAPV